MANLKIVPPSRTCLLVHGDDTLLERNQIGPKLLKRGVTVERTVLVPFGSSNVPSRETMGAYSCVCAVLDRLKQPALRALSERCKDAGVPLFVLPHQVSGPEWARLEQWAALPPSTAREILNSVVAAAPGVTKDEKGNPTGTSDMLGGTPSPLALMPSTLAQSIIDLEKLAEMYSRENDELRRQVENLKADRATADAKWESERKASAEREAINKDEREILRDKLAKAQPPKSLRAAVDDQMAKTMHALVTLVDGGAMTPAEAWDRWLTAYRTMT